MNIIRDYLVELAKYLPEFLRQDQEMSAILEAESREHRVQVEILKDLVNQLFVDSATWGLSNFERNLGLQPEADDDFVQRRNRILLYLQQKRTVNKEFMEALFRRYVSEDSTIKVVEDNPENTFWVIDTGGQILYPKDLFDAIETYKPAHLRFGLQIEREIRMEAENAIRIGIVSATSGVKKFGIRHPPDGNLPYGIKVLSGISGIVQIGAGPNILRASEKDFLGAVTGEYRRKIIKANAEDLPESMKNILESSRAAPRIGISLYTTRKTNIPIDRPKAATTPLGVGFFMAKTGRRTIRPDTPEAGVNLQYVGSLVAICKKIFIPADTSDLRPPGGNTPKLTLRIGTKMMVGGVKKVALAAPSDAPNTMSFQVITVKTGRKVILANKEDMAQTRMRTNAVGRMHVGLAQIGI